MICRVKSFKPGDAFIGFQKDTPAAVVFQATNHLKKVTESQFSFRQTMITESGILRPEELSDEDQESWSEAVSCIHFVSNVSFKLDVRGILII